MWLDHLGYDKMLSGSVMLVRWWLNITLLIGTFLTWSHVLYFCMKMRIELRDSLDKICDAQCVQVGDIACVHGCVHMGITI